MPCELSIRYSVSSRMCFKYSRTDRGILHFFQDVWTDVRTQRFCSHQVHFPSQEVFEKEGKLHKVVKGLLTRLELDKDINVALLRSLPTHKRTEQAIAPDPKISDLFLVISYDIQHFFFFSYSHDDLPVAATLGRPHCRLGLYRQHKLHHSEIIRQKP
jgi:hypothetical protein